MIQNSKTEYCTWVHPFSAKKSRERVMPSAEHAMLHVSKGPSECGYDIALSAPVKLYQGYAHLASTTEWVSMPTLYAAELVGKSTWARLGVSLNTTQVDPGFRGHVTIEITWNPLWRGWWSHLKSKIIPRTLTLPAGVGIGTLVFVPVAQWAQYDGKYQAQGNAAQGAL